MIHPGLKRDIDPRAVEDYFAYGYVPEPKTIFQAARKLPPGKGLRNPAGAVCSGWFPRRLMGILEGPFPPLMEPLMRQFLRATGLAVAVGAVLAA